MMDTQTKPSQTLVFISFALACLVFCWGLGSIELVSLNEGRRALVIKEMFASGNWLIPTLNGELYLTKPPLLYWISTSFSHFFGGVSEWTLRLPSAIAGLITTSLVYRYTFKKFGAWPALFAAQLLVANAGFAMLARRAEIEMLLAALCAGALICALKFLDDPKQKKWLYLSYALLGFAVLTKGPVALLFITLPLLIAAIWTKDARLKALLTNIKAWVLFLLVALSWYALVTWQLGFDIWANIAKRDMLDKMQAADAAKPLLSYVGWICVDFLLLVGLFFIRTRAVAKSYVGKLEWKVIFVSVAVPLLVFSLFSNKHAKYLLPIYPALAILLSVHLGGIFESANLRSQRIIVNLGLLLPIAFSIFYMVAEARIFAYRTAVFPLFQTWSAQLKANTLYAFGDIDSRLIYYAKKPIKVLSEAELAVVTRGNKPYFVITEAENENKLTPLTGCKVKTFTPYLKKHKALLVFADAEACGHQND